MGLEINRKRVKLNLKRKGKPLVKSFVRLGGQGEKWRVKVLLKVKKVKINIVILGLAHWEI